MTIAIVSAHFFSFTLRPRAYRKRMWKNTSPTSTCTSYVTAMVGDDVQVSRVSIAKPPSEQSPLASWARSVCLSVVPFVVDARVLRRRQSLPSARRNPFARIVIFKVQCSLNLYYRNLANNFSKKSTCSSAWDVTMIMLVHCLSLIHISEPTRPY